MRNLPGRHRRQQPPTWVGIPPMRWYLFTLIILVLILIFGGLL